MKRLLTFLIFTSFALAQSYSVNLAGPSWNPATHTGGLTGTSVITGLTAYAGDYRVDIRLKNCTNPNTGATHNILSGVMSLQWAPTNNFIQMRDWNSSASAGTITTMNASAWPTDFELRMQRVAGVRNTLEKWNATGGGYELKQIALTGTANISFTLATLGASTTGCEVAFARIYLDDIAIGSAPPSAISSPATGALRDWEFNDRASPADDSSSNNADMTFATAPTWTPEDTTIACWATAVGNSTAGAPITLSAYARGTVASRLWQIISQPFIATGSLSSHVAQSPSLLNATAGSYEIGLNVVSNTSEVASCNTTQVVSAPASGTGGYSTYNMGIKFSEIPSTDQIKISVYQPNGLVPSQSPFWCEASPCKIQIDDTGQGNHTYKIERLNASGNVITSTPWKTLNVRARANTGIPDLVGRPATPKMLAVAYANNGALASRFVGQRFDVRITGGDSRPYNPNIHYLQYKDFSGFYHSGEYWKVREFMESQGADYEDIFLHSTIDHGNTRAWTKTNRFGEDQWNTNSNPTKGVMVDVGGVFTDESIDAWDEDAVSDVVIGNGTIYWAQPEPWDYLNLVIGTPRTGGSVVWQYCSAKTGSTCDTWSTLSVTDNSSGFSTAASSTPVTVTWTPPSNWKHVIVNGSKSSFFVRAVVTGASVTPALSKTYSEDWLLYGDTFTITDITHAVGSNPAEAIVTISAPHNYVFGDQVKLSGGTGGWASAFLSSETANYITVRSSSDSTHFRVRASVASLGAYPGGMTVQNRREPGWDPDDPNIITVADTYLYNPTPPAGSSARFRYRARMRNFWASGNDSYLANEHSQNGDGISYYGRYLAMGFVTALEANRYNGAMLDNGDSIPENVVPYETFDWVQPYSHIARRAEMGEAMHQIREYIHNNGFPDAWIFANTAFQRASVCFQIDGCFFENEIKVQDDYNYSQTTGTDGDLLASFDTCSDPELNPLGSTCFYVVQNNETIDYASGSVQAWWDRADRRAIHTYAQFLIGWNGDATTGFSMNAHGSTYSQDDDFYYMCCDTVTTTDIVGHPTNAQTFSVADVSQFWNISSLEMAAVIGEPPNADYFGVNSRTGNSLNTSAIIKSWPAGSKFRLRKIGRQGTTPIDRSRLLWQSIWSDIFLANVGTPSDTNPATGRFTAWKTPVEYGGTSGSRNMKMRLYTNGIVVVRPGGGINATRLDECSTNAISLGGTYYRLHADNKTEATPYTTIKLRENEAFIGLLSPTAEVTAVPAWQQNPCP